MGDADAADDDVFVNDLWSVYFHNPSDDNWNFDGYIKIIDIASVFEFWSLQKQFNTFVEKGMFFIMREHIFPCWDDVHNKDGGCLSVKVLKNNMTVYWGELSMAVLGEFLGAHVNGISTSPKKSFCIVKIWLDKDASCNPASYKIPLGYYGEVLYKANSERF
jgi:hypothetical protein